MIKSVFLITAVLLLFCLYLPVAVLCVPTPVPTGNIQVTLLPADAISAGATWRVSGETAWHASGDSISCDLDSYPNGCTLEFSRVAGWRTPQTRTLTLADGDTTTSTATYYNSDSVVANSFTDFSLVQGYKNWYYGFYYPYGTTDFYQFSMTGSEAYGAFWYQGNMARIWPVGAHPELTVPPVRRWVSNVDSEAIIAGLMWKLCSGGNGFYGYVGINGQLQYANAIAGTDTMGTSYAFNTHLSAGDYVDFFVDAAGNTDYDHCGFTGAISVPVSTGSLCVNIQPAEAVAAGGKWRRKGTTQWFESGETEYDIAVGDYAVELSDVTDWGTPPAQAVTITADVRSNVTCTYLPMGYVKVNIMPAMAVSQNAQWRPVGTTTWHDSGDSEKVAIGDCSIEFKDLTAWTEPMMRTLTVAEDKTTETTGTYHGGNVLAWGANGRGQCSPPSPNREYVAVSGGTYFAVGLRSDGTVAQWGGTTGSIPYPNSDFIAVSCGEYHALGIKSDGSVVCWGNNSYGQCNVPSPNSDFVAVDGGGNHSIGLKSNGSVVCWGSNSYGQCDVPTPNTDYVAVAAGSYHSVAVTGRYGNALAWGHDNDGQCEVKSPNSGYATVACGDLHTLGLKSDGSLYGWGYNLYNQCIAPSPNSGFVAIAGSLYNSVALRSNGSIEVWGSYANGQRDVPSPNSGFTAIGAGFNYTLAIKEIDLGALTVTISPAEAAAAGAKWRRAGTSTWFASGETEYDIQVGGYTIELSELPGWTKTSRSVTVIADQNAAYTATYAITLPNAKQSADGTSVYITGATISAAWPDVFYIEADNRASGIRVEKIAHGLVYGNLADVVGILGTNDNGERFIQASTATKTGDGGIRPLGMTNKLIGGGDLLDSITGIGQMGVLQGVGLNNIGLLVRTTGKIVDVEQVDAPSLPTWFKIDDGSGAQIKCVSPDGMSIGAGWDYVSVTGISSCEKVGTDIIRVIRVRKIDDVTSN